MLRFFLLLDIQRYIFDNNIEDKLIVIIKQLFDYFELLAMVIVVVLMIPSIL